MTPSPALSRKLSKRGGKPDPVDVFLGSLLRTRRNLLGMSQEHLGKASGLTFQQIQKYERGTNRISASRLFHLAGLLNVPVAWFYEQLIQELSGKAAPGFSSGKQAPLDDAPGDQDKMLHRRETGELLRTWYRITDPKQRRQILTLLKSIADGSGKA
ncbi:MAG: helix-turn-helix domain-containing protein [Alphaproteobacteria bacterium]|nr:helix-turn-helix domain-containing protein [Alphaproteobacteria bacterium]